MNSNDNHETAQVSQESFSASVKATGQKSLSLILDEIEARAEKATPGPWELRGSSVIAKGYDFEWISNFANDPRWPNDHNFIAASRTDVPALVKALRKAMKFIHDVDMGGYDVPEQVQTEITAILTESDKALGK